jgi:hypothetical protein
VPRERDVMFSKHLDGGMGWIVAGCKDFRRLIAPVLSDPDLPGTQTEPLHR